MTKSDTTWTFRSGDVQPSEVPSDNVICIQTIFGSTDPCRSESLLYLSYVGLDLDLANNARPGPTHLTITVRHQLGVVDPPPITSLGVSASFDDGATWTPVHVHKDGPASWAVTVDNPPHASAQNGEVWLRADAADADGNGIVQTISHLYGLTH